MKGMSPKSRRRSKQALGQKAFVYLTAEERQLINKAADVERRSVSGFIANAAVESARRLLEKAKKS
jgi:uncharacterized protein (DUF1778 family)